MRFFAKLAVLCNLCFIAAVVFWYIEMHKRSEGGSVRVIQLPWLESTLVILGYGAIIVNLLFFLVWFIFTALKVESKIPKWMLIFNVLLFGCQVYFHFFYK
jgi:hypothetical protein